MRFGPVLFAVTLLLAAGCGGKDSAPTKATSEGPIGKGASGVWIYQPAGKPKDVVVYFHGQGGPEEATPANHLPWIKHLVKRGSAGNRGGANERRSVLYIGIGTVLLIILIVLLVLYVL